MICCNCGRELPATKFKAICKCAPNATSTVHDRPAASQCIHRGEFIEHANCGCAGKPEIYHCNLLNQQCTAVTIGKPGWKHVQACSMCDLRASNKFNDIGQQSKIDQFVAVTALSPRKHSAEHQQNCLSTWKRFGLSIVVRNTTEEISELRESFPMVDHWMPCDDVTTDYSYPTQRILNLAKVSTEIDKPVLLINSDIELYGDQDAVKFDEHSTFVGIRWNYDRSPRFATEFQWGLDAFTFTPKQAALLPDDLPYGIGQAMWDYAIPAILQLNGVTLNFVHQPLLFHRNHPQNWSPEGWQFGAAWLADRYGVEVEYGTNKFRQSLEPNMVYRDGRYQDTGIPISK